MNNENYISEEAFEKLVNGLEYIESFTLYGRKGLKYHIKRLQEENEQLKKELEQCNAIADTNKELAESYYKEIERLKGLLKCDYEDGQTIMAELTTENKQLKENNQAMQEEMARTWAKLDEKEVIIKELLNYLDKNKLVLNNPNILDFYINVKKILDNKGDENDG